MKVDKVHAKTYNNHSISIVEKAGQSPRNLGWLSVPEKKSNNVESF